MKRCVLCHWLLQRWRWLYLLLAGCGAALVAFFFLPAWVFNLILSAMVLPAAMCAIYLRDLRELRTRDHLRCPAPRDGQAEIVMVDAALVDHGPMLLCAAQPVTPMLEMNPHQESGAALMGRAMLLLSDVLPRQDASAVTTALEAQLGLRAQDVQASVTVLERGRESGLRSITVQEEDEEHTYFVGSVEKVLASCATIWEGDQHLMGADDHSRIRSAAQEMSSAGEHLYAYAAAAGDEDAAFLGMIAIGDSVDPVAAAELRELRQMGVTLILRDDGTRHMDVPVLRRNLDVPDLHARPDVHLCITDPYPDKHTLAIIRHEEHDLVRPIRQLREHFSTMAFMQERLTGVMGLCLLCCVLSGGMLSVPACAAVLIAGYLAFGSLLTARNVRPLETGLTALACLLIRLLLGAAAPQVADAAGTLLCLTMSAFLSLTLSVPGRKLSMQELLPLMLVCIVALALQVILSLSVIGAVLLPAAFCIVCGLLIGAVFFFTGR